MRLLTGTILALASSVAFASSYECKTVKRYEVDRIYRPRDVKKGQFSTTLEESPDGAYLSRCAFSQAEKKVVCDRLKVDRVETNPTTQAKKYYVFDQQLDFQLLVNLTSVENDGRGGVQYGRCKQTAK